MRVAIIDADLIGRKKHRFPNLVCEKLSAYWKEKGANVELKLDYENFEDYDQVYGIGGQALEDFYKLHKLFITCILIPVYST